MPKRRAEQSPKILRYYLVVCDLIGIGSASLQSWVILAYTAKQARFLAETIGGAREGYAEAYELRAVPFWDFPQSKDSKCRVRSLEVKMSMERTNEKVFLEFWIDNEGRLVTKFYQSLVRKGHRPAPTMTVKLPYPLNFQDLRNLSESLLAGNHKPVQQKLAFA